MRAGWMAALLAVGCAKGVDYDADGFTDDQDCNDADASIYPGAEEACDGIDNDCDGVIDGDSATGQTTWFVDADNDGYGDADTTATGCDQPVGAVDNDEDCDDGDGGVYPGAVERCDDVDEDCDGTVDEDAIDETTGYADDDNDGYGDPESSLTACDMPAGYVTNPRDCNDDSQFINPAATEICENGVDEDCDGVDDSCDPDPDPDPAPPFDPVFFTLSAAFGYDPDTGEIPPSFLIEGTETPVYIRWDLYSQAHIDSGFTNDEVCSVVMSYAGTDGIPLEAFTGEDWVSDDGDGNPSEDEFGAVTLLGFRLDDYTIVENCTFVSSWLPTPEDLVTGWDHAVGVGPLGNALVEDAITGSAGTFFDWYSDGYLGGAGVVSEWAAAFGWPGLTEPSDLSSAGVFTWAHASYVAEVDDAFEIQVDSAGELVKLQADDAIGTDDLERGVYILVPVFLWSVEWML